MPKVSFIVPVYNSMPYLEKCIDSLRIQTIEDIEIICVNDCSPDNSLDYLENVAKEEKRLKIVSHTTNKRQGGAWNSGVSVATGEFLSFVDADDWVDKNYCERLCGNESFDIVCAYNYYRGEKKSINVNDHILSELNNDLRLYLLLYGISFITNFYRRDFLLQTRFFFLENNMYQDFLTNLLYFKTDKISFYDNPGYHYRIDNVSIQRSMNQNGFWGRLDVAKKEYGLLKSNSYYITYKEAIDYHFYTLYYRNSLTRGFYGFEKINWLIVNKIISETRLILPNIKNNRYYKERFNEYTYLMRIPIILFETLPVPCVNLLHCIYMLIRKCIK